MLSARTLSAHWAYCGITFFEKKGLRTMRLLLKPGIQAHHPCLLVMSNVMPGDQIKDRAGFSHAMLAVKNPAR